MQREFLQEKSLNRSLDNAEKSLNVDLSAKSRVLPYSTTADLMGLNDLYIEERDACDTYRMIFTVNPVCSNILYNAVTEPVYMEGSYSAINLVQNTVSATDPNIFSSGTLNQSGDVIDQIFAIRDTEISHKKIGNFVYHCGYDIFNNHLLRSKEFEHAMISEKGVSNKEVFNTIFDFAVDYSGKTVQRVIGESEGPLTGTTIQRTPIRMYALDTIKTMNTAFYDSLRLVDGWYGFYNTGYINIPNGKLGKENISVNRVLNNETRCEFIDLYPDRSLYSFIPKINRYKKRLERNWDCTIVYPYASDTDTFNRVMMGISERDYENISDDLKPNAIRISRTDIVFNNVGDAMVEAHSLLRHTLVPGDTVRLLYAVRNEGVPGYNSIQRYSVPVRVVSVGDALGNDTRRCFMFKFNDINTFADVKENEDGRTIVIKDGTDELVFFYRKMEGGCDNRYYFRKFKEIKNYQYVQTGATSEAVEVKKEPQIITEESPEFIKFKGDYFKKVDSPLNYTQNKLAFGVNIYGDRVAQVIFNDDICVSGLKDNLGRPLSTVYFMVAKTNRGYKEWYEDGVISGDSIEYSHCFGELTSGLDLPYDHETADYNVRKLHNVAIEDCVDNSYVCGLTIAMEEAPTGSNYNGTPLPLETGIALSLSGMSEFYGDIVEFSKVNFMETTIEKVHHRFNTAQRECLVNPKYFGIHYDELVGDLYDVKEDTGE